MSNLTKWNPFRKSDELEVQRGQRGVRGQSRDPFREMEDVMRSMQRAFAQTLGPWSGQSFQFPARGEEELAESQWIPSVDISESENEFVLKAELPELKKEDIKVNVEDDTLTISGERRVEKEEKEVRFHRVERAYGRFERSFTLPDEADLEKITSDYKDGILTVHVPKNPNAKPEVHQIEVQ